MKCQFHWLTIDSALMKEVNLLNIEQLLLFFFLPSFSSHQMLTIFTYFFSDTVRVLPYTPVGHFIMNTLVLAGTFLCSVPCGTDSTVWFHKPSKKKKVVFNKDLNILWAKMMSVWLPQPACVNCWLSCVKASLSMSCTWKLEELCGPTWHTSNLWLEHSYLRAIWNCREYSVAL